MRSILLLGPWLLVGCSSATRVESDESWPLEHGARALFVEEGQRAYATGSSAASDVIDVVREVRHDYSRITGQSARPVLAIAYDDEDEPPADDFSTRWSELFERSVAYRQSRSGEGRSKLFGASLRDDGDDALTECLPRLVPLILEVGSIGPQPHKPNSAVQTVLVLPTTDCREAALDDMIEFGMDREEVPLWQRIAVAPFLGIMVRKLDAKFEEMARYLIFESLVLDHEPAWSSEDAKRWLEEYSRAIGLEEPLDLEPDEQGRE